VTAEGAVERYDFRTGTELSREPLSHLRTQCERLAAALSRVMQAYLDCPTDFGVGAVEAMSFDRYLGELPERALLGLVEMRSRLPGMWWQVDAEVGGTVLGRMLGGEPLEMDRPATALESAVLRRFVQELVDVWASSWPRLARWGPAASQVVADGAQLQAAIHAGEIIRVTFQAEVAQTAGRLALLLPVGTAQRLIAEDGAGDMARQAVDATQASRAATAITVPVAVLVHSGSIPLAEAMQLREGDVLPWASRWTTP